MARPIKETPIVSGKDAIRFAEPMANPTPETKEEKAASKRAYSAVKAIIHLSYNWDYRASTKFFG